MGRLAWLLIGLAVLLEAPASAAADHFWQFEDQPGFSADSIGSAHLVVNTAAQATLPASGRGSSFPGQRAADFGDDASILGVDIAPLVGDFTIEMYVHFDVLNGPFATNLFAQGVCNGQVNILSDVRRDGLGGTALNEVRVSSENGTGGVSQFNTGFVPEVGVDYYLAFVHDDSENTVVFYSKDLTNGGGVQTATFQGFVSYPSAATRFEVGDFDSDSCGTVDFGHDGLVDDVRVSYEVLDPSQLLEQPRIVPTGSLGIVLLGGALIVATRAIRRSQGVTGG